MKLTSDRHEAETPSVDIKQMQYHGKTSPQQQLRLCVRDTSTMQAPL